MLPLTYDRGSSQSHPCSLPGHAHSMSSDLRDLCIHNRALTRKAFVLSENSNLISSPGLGTVTVYQVIGLP